MSQDPKSKLRSNGTDFTSTIHHDTYDFVKPEQFHLKGCAIFITGASKGVGREAALSAARAGVSYIGLGARSSMDTLEGEILDAARGAGKEVPTILATKLDVSDEDDVKRAAQDVEKSFGRLDVLFNNAGFLEPFVPITESRTENWLKAYDVNIRGTYLMTKYMLPLMLKGGLKTVMNVSSIGALNTTPGASGYQTSKLALVRFCEHLNNDYREQGVLSFSIHPGGVLTELARGMPERAWGMLTDTPQLAADSMIWLVAERRDWLAGRYVSVTWDMQELLEKREKIVRDDLLKIRMDVGLDY